MNKEKLYFFPRDIEFWAYHCICVCLLIVSLVVIVNSRQDVTSFLNFLGFFVWTPLFTMATLSFRYIYKKKNWSSLNIQTLIIISFSLALVFSVMITILIFASLSPVFIANFLLLEQFYVSRVPVLVFTYHVLVVSTLQSFVFISAWIFIYVSITSSRRIKESDYETLKLENSLKNAKIKSLSNQINPHFLFNTLNNIRFVMYESIHRAEYMMTSLSHILRYSLVESEKDKVLISAEWEITQRYLAIIELQFDKKINPIVNIDKSLYLCLIPPMTLQFLIDNAVKHGNILPPDGYLSVSLDDQADHILIVVENAIQFTKGTLPIEENLGTGTGLKNLQDRLQLLYQNNAKLEIEARENMFTVRVRLPKEKGVA